MIVYKFDIRILIKIILERISKFIVLIILCINLKSLYYYLIKQDTISKKQLIIDMISLC